jgi:mannose-6-phosphate isomerase-like protein (cupin superfamily)
MSSQKSVGARRIVTGHDAHGKSIILSDGALPQNHGMSGPGVGANFVEMWSTTSAVPVLTATEAAEPNARDFTIMPPSGHLLRLIELYPPGMGGHRTVMHRTRTLDYVVVIDGEVVLLLDDSEVVLGPGDVVVQRGTNHAWENRSDKIARCAFFHIDATFVGALLDVLPKPLELMA